MSLPQNASNVPQQRAQNTKLIQMASWSDVAGHFSCVSKGALHQATATLSAHLIPRGITVNAVNPGPTDTGWDVGDPAGHMPLGRWGTPEDAARLVGWLCTDDAAWITGQVIDSEGGFVRHRF